MKRYIRSATSSTYRIDEIKYNIDTAIQVTMYQQMQETSECTDAVVDALREAQLALYSEFGITE